MPSRRIAEGDTVYVRATALNVGSEYLEILIDDGSKLSVTAWVPGRECARQEDIGKLKPLCRPGKALPDR